MTPRRKEHHRSLTFESQIYQSKSIRYIATLFIIVPFTLASKKSFVFKLCKLQQTDISSVHTQGEKVWFKNQFSYRDKYSDFFFCVCVDRKIALLSAIFLKWSRLFAMRCVCERKRDSKISFLIPSYTERAWNPIG